MIENKNEVINDFIEMTKQSWTYGKMTKEEKEKMFDLFYSNRIVGSLKGTYQTQYEILNSIYYSFLIGLGYNQNWRENNDEEIPIPLF